MKLTLRTRLVLWSTVTLIVLTLAFLVWGVDVFFSPRPPLWLGAPELASAPLIVDAAGTTRLGRASRFRRAGVDACALSGTPSERGLAMGRLFDAESERVEVSLMQTVERFIPWGWVRWLLAKFVAIRNRNLDQYIPAEVLAEMQGMALGTTDVYPEYGPHYGRLLNYLAAHDLSHAFMDDQALAGCTAFGATTRATQDGEILLARNFDFEAGPAFDVYKVVMRVQPEKGHAFLSVSWPGMFGVVSGLNDAGLGVVLLAGHSADKPDVGTPISVVARQVLEQAGTLDEAIQIVRAAKVFVSESFLIGSASENLFVVVEKTPKQCAVRGRGEDVVLAANHFLTPELKNDPKNQRYCQVGTTLARWDRLSELVHANLGRLDVARCVSILRDRRAPGGGGQGLGNRQAINGLVASHSVVLDLKQCVIWVSAGPHQLGAFVPFALEPFEGASTEVPIPADDMLTSEAYQHYQKYLLAMDRGEVLLKHGQYQAALADLLEARAFNPEHYRSFYLAGEALQALKHVDEARYNYARALAFHPAFPLERRDIEVKLNQLKEKD